MYFCQKRCVSITYPPRFYSLFLVYRVLSCAATFCLVSVAWGDGLVMCGHALPCFCGLA